MNIFILVGVFIINTLAKILISYVVRIVVNNSKKKDNDRCSIYLRYTKIIYIKDLRDISITVMHMTFNHHYVSSNLVYPKFTVIG